MAAKEIRVKCPCCQSLLEVDVLTEKVMKVLPGEGADGGAASAWDAAHDKVSGRLQSASDKLDSSLAREKSRAKDLDELFRKINRKPNDEAGDGG